ncbi:MAG: TIGR03086 family metal-binding protein [Ilumatobacteraceae bacterium]
MSARLTINDPATTEHTARLERLAAAWSWTTDRISDVHPDDLARPTPCAEWDLAELLDHLAQSVERFVTVLGGTVPETAGTSPAERFGLLRTAHLTAWDGADAASSYDLPFGLVPARLAADLNLAELVLHGWDVSRATGERADIPDHLAVPVLALGEQLLTDETRSGAFAPAVDVAADAGASNRTAAWYGRRP